MPLQTRVWSGPSSSFIHSINQLTISLSRALSQVWVNQSIDKRCLGASTRVWSIHKSDSCLNGRVLKSIGRVRKSIAAQTQTQTQTLFRSACWLIEYWKSTEEYCSLDESAGWTEEYCPCLDCSAIFLRRYKLSLLTHLSRMPPPPPPLDC